MKRLVTILIPILGFLQFDCCIAQEPATFAGEVKYASNGEPVRNATINVYAKSTGSTLIARTVANSSGTFILGIKASEIRIQAVDSAGRTSLTSTARPSNAITLRVADPAGHQTQVFGDAYGRLLPYQTDRAQDASALFEGGRSANLVSGVRMAWNRWARGNASCPSPAFAWKCNVQSLTHGVTGARGTFQAVIQNLLKTSHQRRLLVFVHGFSTSFEDALQASASIAFHGAANVPSWNEPIVAFSWPANANAIDYLGDATAEQYSEDDFRDALTNISKASGGAPIDVVAHSMGAELVFKTLTRLGPNAPRIGHVFFVAPDLDLMLFQRDYKKMLRNIDSLHVYVSRYDDALKASTCVNGVQRLGLADGLGPLPSYSGVEIIDASNVEPGTAHHTYVTESPLVGIDIANVVLSRQSARDLYLSRSGKAEVLQGHWSANDYLLSAVEAAGVKKLCAAYRNAARQAKHVL